MKVMGELMDHRSNAIESRGELIARFSSKITNVTSESLNRVE